MGFGANRFASIFSYGFISQVIESSGAANRAFVAAASCVLFAVALLASLAVIPTLRRGRISRKNAVRFAAASQTLVVCGLIPLLAIWISPDLYSDALFVLGALPVSAGSACMLFAWGSLFGMGAAGQNLPGQRCGRERALPVALSVGLGFLLALGALVPFNLLAQIARAVVLIAVCLVELACFVASLPQTLPQNRKGILEHGASGRGGSDEAGLAQAETVPNEDAGRTGTRRKLRKIVLFALLTGVTMGLSSRSLESPNGALTLHASLLRVLFAGLFLVVLAMASHHARGREMRLAYRFSYLLLVTGVLVQMFVPNGLLVACYIRYVGHISMIAVFLTVLFLQARSCGPESPKVVASGLSSAVLGDAFVEVAYVLVSSGLVEAGGAVGAAGPLSTGALTAAVHALLILLIVVNYTAVYTEADIAALEGADAFEQGNAPEQVIAKQGSMPANPHEDSREDFRDDSLDAFARQHRLTAREREVLRLLVAGRSSRRIQDELQISLSTANTHIRHIYEKAGVRTKQELIDAVQEGAEM